MTALLYLPWNKPWFTEKILNLPLAVNDTWMLDSLFIIPRPFPIVGTNVTAKVSALSVLAFGWESEKVELPTNSWTVVIWLDSSWWPAVPELENQMSCGI